MAVSPEGAPRLPRHVAAVDDLEIPEVSVLVRLAVREPLNMRQFMNAANVAPITARKLHDKLHRLGILRTEYGSKGVTAPASIWLTPLGRKIAEGFLQAEIAMAEASNTRSSIADAARDQE